MVGVSRQSSAQAVMRTDFLLPFPLGRAARSVVLMSAIALAWISPVLSQTTESGGTAPKKPARVQPLLESGAAVADRAAAGDVKAAVEAKPAAPTYLLTPVASGVGPIMQFAFAPYPEPQLYVATKDGKVFSFDSIVAGKAEPILDLRGRVSEGGELGLVGLAFHPSFVENHRLFIHYLLVKQGQLLNRIAEYQIEATLCELNNDTEKIILDIAQPNNAHVGGQMLFGSDGMLYFGIGDGGGKNDPKGRGQSRGDMYGAVIRIDINQKPYQAPPNNPLVATGDGLRELWALGLRNPSSLTFDQKGRLFAADSGIGTQEINEIIPAGNYGWSIMDGETCLGMRMECMNQKYRRPLFAYDQPNESALAIVGPRYAGSKLPSLTGKLIFADKVSGKIWAIDPDQERSEAQLILDTDLTITALGTSKSGEVYIADGGKNEVLELGPGTAP